MFHMEFLKWLINITDYKFNNLHDNKINNKVTKFDKSIKLKSVDFGYDNKKYLKI